MPITHVRSTTAMRIVRLDKTKFNEAVADGFYNCAPATIRGSMRVFQVEQLVPLYFFARLLEFGLPARRAGQLACEAWNVSRLRGAEAADRIILLRGQGGESLIPSSQEYPDTTIKNFDPEHEKPGRNPEFPEGMLYQGISPVLFTVEFYISHVRKIIDTAIVYEQSILGEDEDE